MCGSVVAFYVDGKTIPDVDWDVGPSWAGLLPISGSEDETRKVWTHRGGLFVEAEDTS